MSPEYSAALGFHVGLPSSVRESEGMLNRGQAETEDEVETDVRVVEDVVDMEDDLGRVLKDVVDTEVDLGRVDVGVGVEFGLELCAVFCSCVFWSDCVCSSFSLELSLSLPSSPPPPPPPASLPVPPQKGQMQIPEPLFPPLLQNGQMQNFPVPREPRVTPQNTPPVPIITAPVAHPIAPAELVVASEVVTVVVPVKFSKPGMVSRIKTMDWPLTLSVISEGPDVSKAARSEDIGRVKFPDVKTDDLGDDVIVDFDVEEIVVANAAAEIPYLLVVALEPPFVDGIVEALFPGS